MNTAILLSAGESRRMGSAKALLDWNGEPLIEYQVERLRRAGFDEIICVLGHGARAIRPHAERAGATVVVNANYTEGRASSLRAGAFALPPEASEVAILSIDQPRSAEILRVLLENHLSTGALITLPTFEGKHGHPALLCGSLIPELQRVKEETKGLREIIHRRAADIHELPFDTDAVLMDLNTPEEYKAAKKDRRKGPKPKKPSQ